MKKGAFRVLAVAILLAHLTGLLGVAMATEETSPHFEIVILKSNAKEATLEIGEHVTVNIDIVNMTDKDMKYAALQFNVAYDINYFTIGNELESAIEATWASKPDDGTIRMAHFGTERSLTNGRATVLSFSLVAKRETAAPTEINLTGGILANYQGDAIFQNASASAPLTVSPKTLTGISVKTPPTETAYIEGNKFAPNGLVITLTYSNNATEDIAYNESNKGSFTFVPAVDAALTTGNTAVTITYGNKSTSQTITVAPKTLTNIAIATPPGKTSYFVGEPFDATAMVVTATYSNSSTKAVSSYTYTPSGALAETNAEVIVSYTEAGITRTATQDIRVQKSDRQKLDEAKPPVEAAVVALIATNDTTAADILSAANTASTPDVEVAWKTGDPTILAATASATGRIIGTLLLSCGAETAEIAVDKTIAKLESTFIITFDATGGSVIPGSGTTGLDGKLISLPTPTRSGSYSFAGWYTAAADGTPITPDAIYTVNTTIYAHWSYTGGSSSSGGGSDTASPKPTQNPDGSTTTTQTDKKTGTVTETTKFPNGRTQVVETTKDGTITAKVENPDGTKVNSTTTSDGKTTAIVSVPTDTGRVSVTIPTPAKPKPGEVAVLVHADGTREVVKTSVATDDGLKVTLPEGGRLEIVDNSKAFADVPGDNWAADEIQFATSRELFNGTGKDSFSPTADMSRAMLVTVLARLDGQDTAEGETWYSGAVDWARETGISDGANCDEAISREQLAVMLYRYAKAERAEDAPAGFADGEDVSAWAVEAMSWAVKSGIITGKNGALDPCGNATRAEVAAMLQRFVVVSA